MDYAKLLLVVQSLINKTGRQITIQRLDSTAINASKPWKGPGVPTVGATTTVKATFVPATGDFSKKLIDTELLKRADEVCLLAPLVSFPIETSSVIIDDTSRWRIEWVHILKPADTELLYALGVCR